MTRPPRFMARGIGRKSIYAAQVACQNVAGLLIPWNWKRNARMNPKYLLAATALTFSGALLADAPAAIKDGMLVDDSGMTLYTYDKDSLGKSACVDKCAENWPPLQADMEAEAGGDWTAIERSDGTMQWAYKGRPLYTFMQDNAPGDMNGEGKGGVWHMAKP